MHRKGPILAAAMLAATAAAVVLRTGQVKRKNPPSGHVLEVEGVRLHYIEAGAGEPIVFLHGNGSLIEELVASDLVGRLARTHRVIVFDRPGYGYSKRPRSRIWSAAAQADLLREATAKLGAAKAHILAHSWGTLVALEWALRNPGSVRSLALLSGYYFPTPRLDVVIGAGPAVPVLGDVMRYTITPLMARLIWPALLRKLFEPACISEPFRKLPRSLILAPHALRASAEEAAMMVPAAAALVARYPALKLPVLVITGDGDRMVDGATQSRRLSEQLPDSRLLVLGRAGHMVHHTHPARVAEAVAEITVRGR